jgi:hypothetical protein
MAFLRAGVKQLLQRLYPMHRQPGWFSGGWRLSLLEVRNQVLNSIPDRRSETPVVFITNGDDRIAVALKAFIVVLPRKASSSMGAV